MGHRRGSCVLDNFSRSKKTQAGQTSGHSEPLGCNSARCDTLFSTHVFLYNLVRFVPHVGPGRWSVMYLSGVDCVVLIVCIFSGISLGTPWAVRFSSTLGRPSGDRSHVSFPRASTVLIPLMASRLMLSLKKAATEQMGIISLAPTTNPRLSGTIRTLRFASRTPSEFPEVPRTPVPPGFAEEDVELGSVPRTLQGGGYDYELCSPPARLSSDGMASPPDPPSPGAAAANLTHRCRISWGGSLVRDRCRPLSWLPSPMIQVLG